MTDAASEAVTAAVPVPQSAPASPQRVDPVGELIRSLQEGLPTKPTKEKGKQPREAGSPGEGWPMTNSNSERDRRRRLLYQAHEALCRDAPLGGKEDYRKLFPYCHCVAHVSNLACAAYFRELIRVVVSRGLPFTSGPHYRSTERRDSTSAGGGPGPGTAQQQSSEGSQVVRKFIASMWDVFDTPLDEKKTAKEDQYTVQAVALGGLLDGLKAFHPRYTTEEDAQRFSGVLTPLLAAWGEVQRYEKRSFSDSKTAFEARYDGLAMARTSAVELLSWLHHRHPTQVPLMGLVPIVAQTGYKARDWLLTRSALRALARSSDYNAIVSIANKLPTRYDPVQLSHRPSKASLKTEWQQGPQGHLQLWDDSTSIALGEVCCRAMTLSGEANTDCPPQFFECFSILLHHPSSAVFLSCCAHYFEHASASSLQMCRATDPVFNSPETSTLDHLFDRLLGACATLSQCELLATLAMVERFTEKAFEQKLTRDVVNPAWFATLPATLSTIWEKHRDVFGVVLAALRVWGALLLLERCLSTQPHGHSHDQHAADKGDTISSNSNHEEAADGFFRFILQHDVIRTLHITYGTVLFDILEHFVEQLGGAASRRLHSHEISQLLRRVCCVLIEACFLGCPERRCMATVTARSSQVLHTMLTQKHFHNAHHRPILVQCGREIVACALEEGSLDIAHAVGMVLESSA